HYVMSSRPGVMNSAQVAALRELGLVQIGGARQGLGAIDRVGRHLAERKPLHRSAQRAQPRLADLLGADRRVLNEYDAQHLLAGPRLAVARARRGARMGAGRGAADALGSPGGPRAVPDDTAHKPELGLAAVGLGTGAALAPAFPPLHDRLDRLDRRPADAAFLVQEFVPDGVEVFAGISGDPNFGLSIAFGMGGVAVEVTRDFALRLLPLREGDAEAMIDEVRGAALLVSARGRRGPAAGSLPACLYALADFAGQNAERLAEVDLNPIKVRAEGRGCVIVDALIVARAAAGG